MSRIRPRDSRLNIRVDLTLRQAIEDVARDMDCSVSMAARYLLGEAVAFRRIEARGAQFDTADDLLRHIAASEIRAFKQGGVSVFLHDLFDLLRVKGIKPPRL